MEQKFYICNHCGNIIAKVKDSGVPVVCCGSAHPRISRNHTHRSVLTLSFRGCERVDPLGVHTHVF